MTNPRLATLLQRHRELDEEVSTEQRRVAPDRARLEVMKSEKLRLKDQIEGLQQPAISAA